MVLQQVLKALLDSLGVHVAAGGELDAIPQGDGPGVVTVVRPLGCEPGLQFHVVGVVHQRLTNTIADAGPAVVGAVRVDGLFPVFCVECGVADRHGLLPVGKGGSTHAGKKAQDQAQGQCEG